MSYVSKTKIDLKRLIIIINIVILFILLIKFTLSYFSNLKENVVSDVTDDVEYYIMNDYKYLVPEKLKYEQINNIDAFQITGGDNWIAIVYVSKKEDSNYKNQDEFYNYYIKNGDSDEIKVERKDILGHDTVIFNYINKKKIAYSYISNYDYCYTITVEHVKDDFDVNSIYDVIKSLDEATKV